AARLTHYEHHKHANHPEFDPDINTKSDSAWHMVAKDVANQLKTASPGRAAAVALIYALATNAALFGFAWAGYALEVAALVWLPRIIGGVYIRFFLSWAPHHPATDLGRYRDTRGFRSRLGN